MAPELDPEVAARERARQRRLRQQQIQRRRTVLGVCLLGLIVLIVVLALTCSGGEETPGVTETTTPEATLPSAVYGATLTGSESVPPVETAATASLTLTFDGEENKLTYVLEVTSAITNPSSAVIYQGSPGASGSAVYLLYTGPMKEGSFIGVLAEGEILETDLIGPLRGGSIADLIALIESGKAYVSIGNKSHPVDAIRGQISELESLPAGTEPSTETEPTS